MYAAVTQPCEDLLQILVLMAAAALLRRHPWPARHDLKLGALLTTMS